MAGALDRPLAHIVPDAAVAHETHAAAGLVCPRAGGKIFLEYRTVGLVAGGIEVRDVVGDHVHFARERDLARQSDETRILHRHSPLLIQPGHASRGLPCRKRARQALPSRRLVKSLQPPCQVIKPRKISLLVENCEVAGGAKTAVLAALPGKRFRPRGPQKASVNHTDLPSIVRGARGGAHPRCLARDTAIQPRMLRSGSPWLLRRNKRKLKSRTSRKTAKSRHRQSRSSNCRRSNCHHLR